MALLNQILLVLCILAYKKSAADKDLLQKKSKYTSVRYVYGPLAMVISIVQSKKNKRFIFAKNH